VGLGEIFNGIDFGNFMTQGSGSGRVDSLVVELSAGNLVLTWNPSCVLSDLDYEVYEGDLGSWNSHVPVVCSTNGLKEFVFPPPMVSAYYLVVPTDLSIEGSYGEAQPGGERPQGPSSCLPQGVTPCP
jgi:hypothetical protein